VVVLYYRDEKVSLEQQINMKAKQMQATKQEIKKIKGEIEEVSFMFARFLILLKSVLLLLLVECLTTTEPAISYTLTLES
jgi:hypothetical protein